MGQVARQQGSWCTREAQAACMRLQATPLSTRRCRPYSLERLEALQDLWDKHVSGGPVDEFVMRFYKLCKGHTIQPADIHEVVRKFNDGRKVGCKAHASLAAPSACAHVFQSGFTRVGGLHAKLLTASLHPSARRRCPSVHRSRRHLPTRRPRRRQPRTGTTTAAAAAAALQRRQLAVGGASLAAAAGSRR